MYNSLKRLSWIIRHCIAPRLSGISDFLSSLLNVEWEALGNFGSGTGYHGSARIVVSKSRR